jgi:hypothetical protein
MSAAEGVNLVEPMQEGVDAQTHLLLKLMRLQGEDGNRWRRVDAMRALMAEIVRSPEEAKRALLNALQTGVLTVQTVVFLVHLMLGDSKWFAGRAVDLVDEKAILNLHNWAMIFPLEKKEKYQFDRWSKVVDKLHPYPILPFDWAEPEIVQYNQSLVLWATAEADRPSGAGMTRPHKLMTRDDTETKVTPAKPMKVAGGAVLPVQDVNGVLMADATVIEEAFKNMNAQRIVAEERIMALEAQVAALQAQVKQGQPQQFQQYQQYQPRNRTRSMGRGNGTRACFNCGSQGHFLKDCPTKPTTTNRPPQ